MSEEGYRIESDSMGEMRVPDWALWGASTQRAVENFPISGLRFPRSFIRALGMVKLAAARVNARLGLLDEERAGAIAQAAAEVMEGKLDDHFVADVFQTGSGTSTNMNANEVIANRASELMGKRRGEKEAVHPNDHVNRGQSSNDVIPTCIHVAALEEAHGRLLPALEKLERALAAKAGEFDKVLKIGRTHLQDATPVRLGQEFGGYASMVEHGIRRVKNACLNLAELAIGGTAVGTGINTHPEFAKGVVDQLNEMTGLNFREAENHFESQAAKDAAVEMSGVLRGLAVGLTKIANDIRWMGSGPRCSIGELRLPEVQPGSSIMPGKVNPVIAESVCQVAAQVIGNDAAIAVSGLMGNFELNVMMPVTAHNLLQSVSLLSRVSEVFSEKCVEGLAADEKRCNELVEQSLAMCTSLSPHIGYDEAARIAKEAHRTGRTVREVAEKRGVLPPDRLNQVLDPWSMTEPK